MVSYSPFRAFHHVVVAVDDPRAASGQWRRLFGIETGDDQRVDLGDSRVEFVPSGPGPGGIIRVGVIVDDPDAVAGAAAAAGLAVDPEGRNPVVGVSGVAIELRDGSEPPEASPPSPLRRIHHVVVAVRDEAAALARWRRAFGFSPAPEGPDGLLLDHHVPVGDAWFGLTATGTDAGALERFVQRRGEGVYALALVVDDRTDMAAAVARGGGRVIGGAGDAQVFVHPASTHGVLVELAAEWPGGIRRPG